MTVKHASDVQATGVVNWGQPGDHCAFHRPGAGAQIRGGSVRISTTPRSSLNGSPLCTQPANLSINNSFVPDPGGSPPPPAYVVGFNCRYS